MNQVWKWLLVVAAAFVAAAVALQLGSLIGGTERPDLNPLAGLLQVALGRVESNPVTWVLLAVVFLGTCALAAFIPEASSGATGGEAEANRRIGAAAAFTRSKAEARETETAEHLHPGQNIGPGLPLATKGKDTLWLGWRQCGLHIWSTGRGKTTSQVIPHAVAAPGPLVMTTNKVDGVWEIVATRSKIGRVFICDPANVLCRKNPTQHRFPILELATGSLDAEKVGMIFEKATRGTNQESGANAHFDRTGAKNLGRLILAAHLGGLSDREVYNWAMSMDEDTPAAILTDHGLERQADALRGLAQQPADTRGSVWATTQRCASPFEHENVLGSFRTSGVDPARVFDPAAFVTSQDTLILIGDRFIAGTAAFVSVLTWKVFTEGNKAASRQPNGRLAVPMVMELDEVGNAVFLPELPDWYSYAGSRGIVINSYLQSQAQGIEQFGKDGLKKMHGSSNAFTYGGGSSDPEFLRPIVDLVGRYEHLTTSRSTSSGDGIASSRSTSTQQQQREILSVSQLARLSPGKLLLTTSEGGAGIVDAPFYFQNKPLYEEIQTGRAWLIERECLLDETKMKTMEKDMDHE